MKLRFSVQDQIEQSVFKSIEYELHSYGRGDMFIIDDEGNEHSTVDLLCDGLDFVTYN